MNKTDVILLVLIIAALIWAFAVCIRNHKRCGGCCGKCSECGGCVYGKEKL